MCIRDRRVLRYNEESEALENEALDFFKQDKKLSSTLVDVSSSTYESKESSPLLQSFIEGGKKSEPFE